MNDLSMVSGYKNESNFIELHFQPNCRIVALKFNNNYYCYFFASIITHSALAHCIHVGCLLSNFISENKQLYYVKNI